MRTAIVAVLALVAIAAAGMWGLAQFGAPKPMVAEERQPIAKLDASAVAAPLATPPQHEPGAAHPNAADTLKTDKTKTRTVAEAAPAPKPDVVAPVPAPTPAPVIQASPAVAPPAPATSDAKPADALKAAAAAEAKKMLGKGLKGLTPQAAPGAAPEATPSLAPGFAPTPAPVAASPPPPAATAAVPPPAAVNAPAPALPPPAELVQTANAPAAAKAATPPAAVSAAAAAAATIAPPAASLADQFKTRKVAYNRPPTTLYLDRPIDISLVIDATAAADPAAQLQGFPGEVVKRDVDLSDIVSAQLTGVGFDIVSQTVARQTLSSKLPNRWQWRVTPTEPGTRTLMLDIFGYKSGSLDAEPLDAYRDKITVEVQQLDSVIKWAKGIQPLFAVVAAIAGLLSALIAFLRFRRDGKKPG